MSSFQTLGKGMGIQALKAQILRNSPTAYWPCNETSGSTLYDHSGNGHDLTLTGAGAVCGAYDLLPLNDGEKYFSLIGGGTIGAFRAGALGLTMPVGSTPWTYEMCLRCLDPLGTGYIHLFSITGTGETEDVNFQVQCRINESSMEFFWENGLGTNRSYASAGNLQFYPGVPLHLAWVRASTSLLGFYINGRKAAISTTAQVSPTGGTGNVGTGFGYHPTYNNFGATSDGLVYGHAAFYYNTALVESDFRRRAYAAGLWGVNH